MTEPTARAAKELNQRFWACMRQERHHVRVGQRHQDLTDVTFVGMVGDLHGTVCTDCERKED